MKAYIVNLPRSVERRKHIDGQVAAAGLEPTYIDAVDGSQLSSEAHARVTDAEAIARFPEWLTRGAVGCALSHRAAYLRIIDDAVPFGLVLEDDVVLPPNFAAVIEVLSRELHGREVVLLYWRAWGPARFSLHDAVELAGGGHVRYPLEPAQLVTTAAYLITPEACARLADAVIPVRAAADSWGFFLTEGFLERVRCVVPSLVGVRTDFKSAIDYLPASSVRQRAARFIERRRVFPLHQALAARRSLRERRMGRVRLVDESSPLAQTSLDE